MLAVTPQQAVGSQTQPRLRPPGHLLIEQRLPLQELVQVIDQDVGSVGEVLHRVHADAGHLEDDAQEETLVGDHLPGALLVGRQGQQDVRHQVGDTVVAQVDAVVGQVGPGHLQHVTAEERTDLVESVAPFVFVRGAQTEELQGGEEGQPLQQRGHGLQHGVLHPAGTAVWRGPHLPAGPGAAGTATGARGRGRESGEAGAAGREEEPRAALAGPRGSAPRAARGAGPRRSPRALRSDFIAVEGAGRQPSRSGERTDWAPAESADPRGRPRAPGSRRVLRTSRSGGGLGPALQTAPRPGVGARWSRSPRAQRLAPVGTGARA